METDYTQRIRVAAPTERWRNNPIYRRMCAVLV
jgi:hypothetical protein